MASIKELLLELGLADEKTIEVFSPNTRDVPGLKVFRDTVSGVIFVDDYYTGDEAYREGDYWQKKQKLSGPPDYERVMDLERRLKDYKQFYVGKNILDFGCGKGQFLAQAVTFAHSVTGVEFEKKCIDELRAQDIACFEKVDELDDHSIDIAFGFHSFEHVPEPIEILTKLRQKLVENGKVVLEVPHAGDFLISRLDCSEFIDFTLYSQHLILHTRNSLYSFLAHSGFRNITIQAKQRYPLSNHLYWLSAGKPGGHKGVVSSIDNEELRNAYENSLQMIDATDTLVAIAEVG